MAHHRATQTDVASSDATTCQDLNAIQNRVTRNHRLKSLNLDPSSSDAVQRIGQKTKKTRWLCVEEHAKLRFQRLGLITARPPQLLWDMKRFPDPEV
jgi:hypothetical protein